SAAQLPWHARADAAARRSLSLPLPQDGAVAGRGARAAGAAHDRHVPVALRPRQVARAGDRCGVGAGRAARHEAHRGSRAGIRRRLPRNARGARDPRPRAVPCGRRRALRRARLPQRRRSRNGHARGARPARAGGLAMSRTYRFEGFALDADERRLTRGSDTVELNGRYFDALLLLVREPGRLVSKDRFMSEVWCGVPVTDEALTQCIRTLRRQLGDDAGNPRFIETVPKHGYRFIATVEVMGEEEAPAPPVRREMAATPVSTGPARGAWSRF